MTKDELDERVAVLETEINNINKAVEKITTNDLPHLTELSNTNSNLITSCKSKIDDMGRLLYGVAVGVGIAVISGIIEVVVLRR